MVLLLLACAPPDRLPDDPTLARLRAPVEASSAAWLTTDRAVYRAGEHVYVRVWHVAAGTFAPVDTPTALTLAAIDGGTVGTFTLPAGQVGARVTLPRDAWPGTWSVTVAGPAGRLATTEFAVQPAGRLPWLVDATLGRTVLSAGDALTARVRVTTPDGKPVAGHGVHAVHEPWAADEAPQVATTGPDGVAELRWLLPEHPQGGDVVLRVDGMGGPAEFLPYRVSGAGVTLTAGVEGGALVAGVPATVAVLARDRHDLPVDGAGQLVADGVPPVPLLFVDGHATASFTPAVGQRWSAVFGDADAALPAVLPDGCALTVEAAARPIAHVRCTAETELWLVARNGGVAVDGAHVRTHEHAVDVPLTVPGDAGVVRVELYGAGDTLLATRSFVGTGRALGIDATVTGSELVLTTTVDGAPVDADLAVAVVREDAAAWADTGPADLWTGLVVLPGRSRSPAARPTAPALDALLVADASSGSTFAKLPTARVLAADAPSLAWPEGLALDDALPLPAHLSSGVREAVTTLVDDFRPSPNPVTETVDVIHTTDGDTAAVDAAVARIHDQLVYCNLRERRWGEGLAGELRVAWTIGPDGRVVGTTVLASTLDSPSAEACLSSRLATVRGPTGRVTHVTTTLTLAASGPPSRPLVTSPADTTPYSPDPRGPETAAWWPSVHTGATGRTTLGLPALGPGAWRVHVDGVGGGAAASVTAGVPGR